MEHGSPPAFQIPRRDGDEDEKGAVALEDNLRRTPGGVWVQETVHRLEPGGDTDAGSELLLGTKAEDENLGDALTSMDPPRRKRPLSN